MRKRKATFIALGSAAVLALSITATPMGRTLAQETRAVLVEVVNTPNVNLSGPVTIGNAPANPVPIVDVFSSPRQPFRAHLSCADNSMICGADPLTVPAGKLLVIETYSANCNAPLTVTAVRASIVIPQAQGSPATFYFPLQLSFVGFGPLGGSGRHHALTSAVRLYADPSTEVSFQFVRSIGTFGVMACEASISGLLLDCPGPVCTVS